MQDLKIERTEIYFQAKVMSNQELWKVVEKVQSEFESHYRFTCLFEFRQCIYK